MSINLYQISEKIKSNTATQQEIVEYIEKEYVDDLKYELHQLKKEIAELTAKTEEKKN